MGIRQLRDNLTSTIRRVRKGETIEITHHGAPAGGDLTPGEPAARRPPRFPVTGELTASQAIEDDRAER